MKKPKQSGCAHKGCRIKHKSSGGYCWKHAHEADRQTVQVSKRPVGAPMLYEERGYYDRDD